MFTVEPQAAMEATVVGGDDERTGPARQCGFQHLQGLDVEMVGRLVEQEAGRALLGEDRAGLSTPSHHHHEAPAGLPAHVPQQLQRRERRQRLFRRVPRALEPGRRVPAAGDVGQGPAERGR